MPFDKFRRDFYPYCLEKAKYEIGGYVILNRKYEPLSALHRIKYLTKKTIIFLSWNDDDNKDKVFLYADHILPTKNKKNWDNYSEKLFKLGELQTTFKNQSND